MGRPRVQACDQAGLLKRPKSPCPGPSPGLRDYAHQPQYPGPPLPTPPPITTRGREKGAIYRCRPCGCPNRAGWGGPGNSWGPGEEAGFPGVGWEWDTGLLTWRPQAYLNTHTDPTPTTIGAAKATGSPEKERLHSYRQVDEGSKGASEPPRG